MSFIIIVLQQFYPIRKAISCSYQTFRQFVRFGIVNWQWTCLNALLLKFQWFDQTYPGNNSHKTIKFTLSLFVSRPSFCIGVFDRWFLTHHTVVSLSWVVSINFRNYKSNQIKSNLTYYTELLPCFRIFCRKYWTLWFLYFATFYFRYCVCFVCPKNMCLIRLLLEFN